MSWSLDVETRHVPDPDAVERTVRLLSSVFIGRVVDIRIRVDPNPVRGSVTEDNFQWRVRIGPEPEAIVVFGGRYANAEWWGADLVGWWDWAVNYWSNRNADVLFIMVLLGLAIATLGDGRLSGPQFGRDVETILAEEIPVEPIFRGHQDMGEALRALGFDNDRITHFYGWSDRYTAALSDEERLALAAEAEAGRARLTALMGSPNASLVTLGNPATIVSAIQNAIDQARAMLGSPDSAKTDPVARDCAALLGEQICRAYGWTWCRLHWLVVGEQATRFDRYDALAVSDPDLMLVLRPHQFLRAQIEVPVAEPLGIVDLFSSLSLAERATHFPEATRGSLLFVDEDIS